MEYEVGLYKREKSTRIGVGLGTKPDHDGVKVKELVPDRLAALSGKLQEGDVVLEVNGQRVSDREGAAAALSAQTGEVKLRVRRAPPPVEEETRTNLRAAFDDLCTDSGVNGGVSWAQCCMAVQYFAPGTAWEETMRIVRAVAPSSKAEGSAVGFDAFCEACAVAAQRAAQPASIAFTRLAGVGRGEVGRDELREALGAHATAEEAALMVAGLPERVTRGVFEAHVR